jgi:adenosylhomocysteinase
MLPVTKRLLRRALARGLDPAGVGLFVIQHLLDDTECFIRAASAHGFKIIKVLGIEYSSKAHVVEHLRRQGFDVTVPALSQLADTARDSLGATLRRAARHGAARILVQEVGGYCSAFLAGNPELTAKRCTGVVEETKQGLWEYEKVCRLPIPVVQIADSHLKRVEATYVGDAVARAVEQDLLQLGMTLRGQMAGVLGFGDIGAAVAGSLRARGACVLAYDPDPLRMVQAIAEGFSCPDRVSVLRRCALIIGASGTASVTYRDLRMLADNAILISASSKCLELPVERAKSSARRIRQLTDAVDELTMPWGARVMIVGRGFPVNFRGSSLPASVSDLLFAQIVACIEKLLTQSLSPGIHSLSKEEQTLLGKSWLEHYA